MLGFTEVRRLFFNVIKKQTNNPDKQPNSRPKESREQAPRPANQTGETRPKKPRPVVGLFRFNLLQCLHAVSRGLFQSCPVLYSHVMLPTVRLNCNKNHSIRTRTRHASPGVFLWGEEGVTLRSWGKRVHPKEKSKVSHDGLWSVSGNEESVLPTREQ